jgi:hypothetical protein
MTVGQVMTRHLTVNEWSRSSAVHLSHHFDGRRPTHACEGNETADPINHFFRRRIISQILHPYFDWIKCYEVLKYYILFFLFTSLFTFDDTVVPSHLFSISKVRTVVTTTTTTTHCLYHFHFIKKRKEKEVNRNLETTSISC